MEEDAGIEIAQDLTPNLMEITGVVTSRLKTRRCGIFFCGLAMKLMLSKKKMAAKIPLKIKWSGVNTAENVGQGTMVGGRTGVLCGYVSMSLSRTTTGNVAMDGRWISMATAPLLTMVRQTYTVITAALQLTMLTVLVHTDSLEHIARLLSAHPPARTTDTAVPEMDVRSASVRIISLAIIAKLLCATDRVRMGVSVWPMPATQDVAVRQDSPANIAK